MNLKEVLKNVSIIEKIGGLDLSISGISFDSRKTEKGNLFVAIEGFKNKGSDYLSEAVSKGAVAYVYDQNLNFEKEDGVAYVKVPDSRGALSTISANYFGHPSNEMTVIGVTGTNGKTTTTYLVESILKEAGKCSALLGTINYRGPGVLREAQRTTPESLDLQRFLREMNKAGATHIVMEASSHALALKRLNDVNYDICIFTNLTQDHLDFHRTVYGYMKAKSILFSELLPKSNKKEKYAVINNDDPFGRSLSEMTSAKVMKYGILDGGDTLVVKKEISARGIKAQFKIQGTLFEIESELTGLFNLSNMLGACSACYCLGINPNTIFKGVKNLKFVPGRLERVPNDLGINIYVDYAHTDDALKNVIGALQGINKGRIITVFGCGGDRDKGKRPLMGNVSTKMSDITVVTSDNPRSEDPETIIGDIIEGIDQESVKIIDSKQRDLKKGEKYFAVVEDRKEAIEAALSFAKEGDVVLIAGKGHETYQEFAREKVNFDDREIVKNILGRF